MERLNVGVVIIGDGPAGSAVALMLARSGISVCLIGLPPNYCNKILFGETVSPDIKYILRYLGVWKEFLNDEHLPSAGNVSAWGSENIKENNFIFHPNTNGWHLDRSKFNSMLLNATKRQGVYHFNSKIESVYKHLNNGFDINLKNHNKLTPDLVCSEFIVDATGRKSWFSYDRGIRKSVFDNLCGYVCFFSSRIDGDLDTMTLIESVSNGWWYSALLPKNTRVVSFFTDSNLSIAAFVKRLSEWKELMQSTNHVRLSVDKYDYHHISGPHIMVSNSTRLDKIVGEKWLAVGDAATTYDPLSSRGIMTALSDGIKASDTIVKYLNGNSQCIEEYNNNIIINFDKYLKQRTHYYLLEKRWSDSPFWKRNQDFDN